MKLLLVFSHVCILILTPRYRWRFMPQYAMHAISLYTNNVHMAVPSALRFTDIIDAESQNCPALHALLYDVIYNVIEA